jgi:hypothetical protein
MDDKKLARFRAIAGRVKTSTTVGLWTCLIATIGLLVASFIVPPMGEISPSALKGGSLLFAFATLLEAREAILEGFGFKLTHGDTTIVVKDQDGNRGQENE